MASNGAVAISETVIPLADLDVRLIGMVLTRNGALVDTGAGARRSAIRSRSSPGSPTRLPPTGSPSNPVTW